MPIEVTVQRSALLALGRAPAGPIYLHYLKLITQVDSKAKLFLSNDMVHVRTGNLRSSQQTPTVTVLGDQISAQAVNIAKYAAFVHNGTRAHEVKAHGKFLTGWSYDGAPVFTPTAMIPAQPARPWLRTALVQVMQAAAV